MADGPLTPDPTIFILYGATGDLAHRLVLPAIFQLAIAGLLPSDWRLIGNGRGDSSGRRLPRARKRQSLEEFGPKPSEGPWDEVRARLRFAGGGFSSSDPGTLPEVVKQAEKDIGGHPQLIHYMASPTGSIWAPLQRPSAPTIWPRALRCLREAVRHLSGDRSPASTASPTTHSKRRRSTGSTTFSGRRRRRTSTCCASPTACSPGPGTTPTSRAVEIDVPETLGMLRCGLRSTSPPVPFSTCW